MRDHRFDMDLDAALFCRKSRFQRTLTGQVNYVATSPRYFPRTSRNDESLPPPQIPAGSARAIRDPVLPALSSSC